MVVLGTTVYKGAFRRPLSRRAFATSSSQQIQNTSDRSERRPSQKLPSSSTRTRFAPSPTGYLHLGSLRTALFNFLLARATGGQFLLRLEDTDQKRTVADAEQRLYTDLRWAGLEWDEGPDKDGPYGPYRQSARTALYQEHGQKLLDSQHAYRCFCSPERTGAASQVVGEQCEQISAEISDARASHHDSHAIRLKMPKRESGYNDLVYGTVRSQRTSSGMNKFMRQGCSADPVLIKSDGYPTYHLANVVDDHHMKITHVIRAAEWMPSTPKHIVMYQAFGWQPPLYAHVGLLQNSDRQKYSKRNGDADLDMRSLAMSGTFPEALVNYVALHGWSHELGDDFLRMPDLIKNFDLKFTKGNTVIAPTKLDYLQRRYAEKYVEERGPMFDKMVEEVTANLRNKSTAKDRPFICSDQELQVRVIQLLRLEAKKYSFPQDFANRISYFFFSEPREHNNDQPFSPLLTKHLGLINDSFANVISAHWDTTSLSRVMEDLFESLQSGKDSNPVDSQDVGKSVKSQLQTFMRWAVSYGHPGPSIVQTMQILGRDVTVGRLAEAVALLEHLNERERAPSTP